MPQNFSGQNLQGHSFRGRDLSRANFSYCDIRGADFSNAILRGANFRHAWAGLQRRWAISLVIGSWLLAAMSGLYSGLAGYLVTFAFDSTKPEKFSAGVASLIMFCLVFLVAIQDGLGAIALAVVVAVAVAFNVAAAFGIAITTTVTATFTFTIVTMAAVSLALAVAGARAIAGTLAAMVAGIVSVEIAISTVATLTVGVKTIALVAALAVTLLGAYVGWQTATDKRYTPLWRVVTLLTKGTSFRGADLTDADFTEAKLKCTDFKNAILPHTWVRQ